MPEVEVTTRSTRPASHRTAASGTIEQNLQLHEFPPPATLWARYRVWKGLPPEAEPIVLQDYFDDGSGKGPRYYQASAVNSAMTALLSVLLPLSPRAIQARNAFSRRSRRAENCRNGSTLERLKVTA